jgi:hydroxymethylpyrimidine pyrophosphatase-like HAD family hydrolase
MRIDSKDRVIFSDVDGTLCFHQQAHGIQELGRNADGTVRVKDPASGREYLACDVSSRTYRVYMDVETRRLAHKVRERYDFVFVTGGRPSTMQSRQAYLDFADAVILESGGLICDGGYNRDQAWFERLQPERAYLSTMREQLQRSGWVLDDADRSSALRVRKMDNLHKPAGEFEQLCRELELPGALKKTINMEHLDIILKSAGKDNAVRFWMETRGYSTDRSIGIGDDINDIDFLRITGSKYVLASAFPETLQAAVREGWYISRGKHFEGINEILRHLLSL